MNLPKTGPQARLIEQSGEFPDAASRDRGKEQARRDAPAQRNGLHLAPFADRVRKRRQRARNRQAKSADVSGQFFKRGLEEEKSSRPGRLAAIPEAGRFLKTAPCSQPASSLAFKTLPASSKSPAPHQIAEPQQAQAPPDAARFSSPCFCLSNRQTARNARLCCAARYQNRKNLWITGLESAQNRATAAAGDEGSGPARKRGRSSRAGKV
ncbi:MAG: hypothetical protein ACTTJV_01080 [Ottowia sp.]